MLQRWPKSAETVEATRALARCEHYLATAVQARSLTASLSPTHVYTVNNNIFTAVSTLLDTELGTFESKKPMIIGSMAKKSGVSTTAAARHLENCCTLGSEAHKQIEAFFTNPDENAVPPFFAKFFTTHLQSRFRLVGAEVRVYNEKTKVAGTIDLVVAPIGQATGEDCVLEVVIFDWKYTKGHSKSERYEKQLQSYAEPLEGVTGVEVTAMYNVFLHQEDQIYYVRAVPARIEKQ